MYRLLQLFAISIVFALSIAKSLLTIPSPSALCNKYKSISAKEFPDSGRILVYTLLGFDSDDAENWKSFITDTLTSQDDTSENTSSAIEINEISQQVTDSEILQYGAGDVLILYISKSTSSESSKWLSNLQLAMDAATEMTSPINLIVLTESSIEGQDLINVKDFVQMTIDNAKLTNISPLSEVTALMIIPL